MLRWLGTLVKARRPEEFKPEGDAEVDTVCRRYPTIQRHALPHLLSFRG